MADITPHPEFAKLIKEIEKLREEVSRLIEKRDYLRYHLSPQVNADYIKKIGVYEYKVFEFTIKVRRLRRKTELIRAKIAKDEIIIPSEIESILDEEYIDYEDRLQAELDRINSEMERGSGDFLSDSDGEELKRLYRKVVKMLHPDLNPDQTEREKIFFLKAVSAYERGDLDALRAIYVLAESLDFYDRDNADGDSLDATKEILTRRAEVLRNDIDKIENSFPLNKREFLEDEEAVAARREDLEEELAGLRKVYDDYYRMHEELKNRGKWLDL